MSSKYNKLKDSQPPLSSLLHAHTYECIKCINPIIIYFSPKTKTLSSTIWYSSIIKILTNNLLIVIIEKLIIKSSNNEIIKLNSEYYFSI